MERISYIHNDTNSIVNQLFFNIVKKKKKDWEKILCLWENYSVIIKEMEIIKLNLGAGQEKANIYHTELTSFKHMANTLWLIQHPLSFKTDNKESFCVCLRQASSDHKAQTATQYGSRKNWLYFILKQSHCQNYRRVTRKPGDGQATTRVWECWGMI